MRGRPPRARRELPPRARRPRGSATGGLRRSRESAPVPRRQNVIVVVVRCSFRRGGGGGGSHRDTTAGERRASRTAPPGGGEGRIRRVRPPAVGRVLESALRDLLSPLLPGGGERRRESPSSRRRPSRRPARSCRRRGTRRGVSLLRVLSRAPRGEPRRSCRRPGARCSRRPPHRASPGEAAGVLVRPFLPSLSFLTLVSRSPGDVTRKKQLSSPAIADGASCDPNSPIGSALQSSARAF